MNIIYSVFLILFYFFRAFNARERGSRSSDFIGPRAMNNIGRPPWRNRREKRPEIEGGRSTNVFPIYAKLYVTRDVFLSVDARRMRTINFTSEHKKKHDFFQQQRSFIYCNRFIVSNKESHG